MWTTPLPAPIPAFTGQARSKFKTQGAARSLEAAAPSPAKALGWPPQSLPDPSQAGHEWNDPISGGTWVLLQFWWLGGAPVAPQYSRYITQALLICLLQAGCRTKAIASAVFKKHPSNRCDVCTKQPYLTLSWGNFVLQLQHHKLWLQGFWSFTIPWCVRPVKVYLKYLDLFCPLTPSCIQTSIAALISLVGKSSLSQFRVRSAGQHWCENIRGSNSLHKQPMQQELLQNVDHLYGATSPDVLATCAHWTWNLRRSCFRLQEWLNGKQHRWILLGKVQPHRVTAWRETYAAFGIKKSSNVWPWQCVRRT